LASQLDEVAELSDAPCAVNVLVPFLADAEVVTVAARGAAVVEFFYGWPDADLVELVHAQGAAAGWQVGSLEEALAAEAAGCDLVTVQGVEAGGHLQGRLGLIPLLCQAVARLTVPVLAVGGIGNRLGAEAVLAAGAVAVRVGTRFVAAAESAAHPRYVEALVAAAPEDTTITEAFHRDWPDAPHRVLAASVAAVEAHGEEPVGVLRVGEKEVPIPSRSVLPPLRSVQGVVEAMPHYAGQSVFAVEGWQPAAEVVAQLAPSS
jgi:NAD(P)H-dependent flavin oxidoreductase YrpB (nitropropane dioxygenase family)